MERVCFQLQVRPERLDEYRQRHAAVWPDMLEALRATGWHNYSLFVRDDGLLIGYFETPSLDDAIAGMDATDVNDRWQAEMSEFFTELDGPADQGFVRLTEVFHLDADDGGASADPNDGGASADPNDGGASADPDDGGASADPNDGGASADPTTTGGAPS